MDSVDSGFYRYEHIFLQNPGISEHSWKKIMQSLWTVITYLSEKCETWNWTWYFDSS